MRAEITDDDRVTVILDSSHSKEHVLQELEAYAPIVSEDCYLVVEDTPAPGSSEALQAFLEGNPSFVVDRECEKFLMTFQPGGYLRRQATGGQAHRDEKHAEEGRAGRRRGERWERALQRHKEEGFASASESLEAGIEES